VLWFDLIGDCCEKKGWNRHTQPYTRVWLFA
jgi:hypothetical protein